MTEAKKINPEDFLSLVTGVRFLQWGSDLQIECAVDAVDRQPWILHFKNCREIHWYVHEPESVQDEEANLFTFSFGEDNHRAPAGIGTDIFDMSVLYESFEIYMRQPG